MHDDLNPPQREAVETLNGPLLVLAGAGSGKTRVVTYRIAHLIKSGVRANRILAVTFTNKAAAEMQERLAGLLGRRKERPDISTFHAHCVKVLRRHIRHLGYPAKFAIYDRSDQESLARSVLREIRVPSESLRPSDLLYLISGWKCRALTPSQAAGDAQSDKEHLAAAGYRRYQRALKNAGAVDFDDLLLCTQDLFERFEEVRNEEAGRYDHVLVDEYQDTNASQYHIVKSLARGHRNLCVVGDDDQSIYGWRGAEVEHILRFTDDWPGAKQVRLEENYRSTAAILESANRLIRFNKNRYDKTLKAARRGGKKPMIEQHKDETVEAKSVAWEILRLTKRPEVSYNDVAILFRTNEQPRPFEQELRRANIPYVLIGGMSFFDRKEVRDMLAYLKVLSSPEDEVSLLRIINNPPRGIGAKSVESLIARSVGQGCPLWEVLPRAASMGSASLGGVSPAAAASIKKLVELIESFRSRLKKQSLAEVMRQLVDSIQYRKELERLYVDPHEQQARWAAVEEVVNALASYGKRAKSPSLTDFLDETALGGREFDQEKEKQLRRNAVVLMTLHSAKGLEFPYVYMVGMEEGLLPHHRSVAVEGSAIDEERRLCYVGMTRAQEQLTLSMALSRMKWGRPRDSIPSRFLFEIIGKAENPHDHH